MTSDWLIDGPRSAKWTIALAHGAGAAMDSEFMTCIAAGLAARGFRVVRFEFPYMAERRRSRKKKPPDRAPVLLAHWQEVIKQLEPRRLIIGGKSMGGRIASMIADDAGVAGLVCLGYPFHPTGKPDKLRIDHLQGLKTPALIVQGERDPFGNRHEVSDYKLSKSIRIAWLPDGDHNFKPRKASGHIRQENWTAAIEKVTEFSNSL